jgi:hypothetical protein
MNAKCCPINPSKEEFLQQKASNFKTFIGKYSPDQEVKDYIDKFRPETLMMTLMTVVLPIITAGATEKAIAELITHLTIPVGEKEAVEAKVKAYFEMFAEVITS